MMKRKTFPLGELFLGTLGMAALSLTGCESEPPAVDTLATVQQPVVVVPSSKLLPNGGAEGRFGYSVDCDGTTAVVGAPDADDDGLAHVFRFDGTQFVQEATLVPSSSQGVGEFGTAVAVQGDTILVGAPGDEPGVAFVFRRSGGTWTEEAKLVPTSSNVAMFGASVALDNDRAAIGAPNENAFLKAGTAHIFRREAGSWQIEATLSSGASFSGDRFGASVALDGDIFAVGAPGAPILMNGSVHVFSKSTGSWVAQTDIDKDGSSACGFGEAVVLSGTTLAVGCPVPSNVSGNPYVNVYERNGSSFNQVQKLLTPGPSSKSWGSALGLDGDALWVGAPRDDEAATDAGAIAAYALDQGTWSLVDRVAAPDAAMADQFGTSIVVFAGAGLVGTPGDGGSSGSVWVVSLQGEQGEPCTTNDGCESGHCVDGVCCENSCGTGSEDDCLACSQAAGASQDGVCEPISGTACEDDDPCTQGGTCVSGTCEGGEPITCEALDECHEPGTCDPNSGCSHPKSEDGKPCTGGTCLDGLCVLPDGGVAGTGGSGASGGSGGSGGSSGSSGSSGSGTGGNGTAGTAGSGGTNLDGGAGSGAAVTSGGGGDSSDTKGFYACSMGDGPRPYRLGAPLAVLLVLGGLTRRRSASPRGRHAIKSEVSEVQR